MGTNRPMSLSSSSQIAELSHQFFGKGAGANGFGKGDVFA